DRDEAIVALRISQAAAGSAEVGVQWRGVLVILVKVAAGRIGLPDLDDCALYGTAVAVEYATGDDDALADRFARVLAGQVVVQLRNRPGKQRRRKIVKPVRELDQRLCRSTQPRADVVRIQIRRFALVFAHDFPLPLWGRAGWGCSPDPTGTTWVWKRVLPRPQTPPGRNIATKNTTKPTRITHQAT